MTTEGFIPINLDETPEQMEPIMVGVRTLVIKDIETKQTDEGEDYYLATLQVNEPDAEDHERLGWERFNFKYAPARTKFKQLCKSAGHSGTGSQVDPSELIDCTVTAEVTPRVYKDKTTNEQKETTQIKRFLWEVEG